VIMVRDRHSLQLHLRWQGRLLSVVAVGSHTTTSGLDARLIDGCLHLRGLGFAAVMKPGDVIDHQGLSCTFVRAPKETTTHKSLGPSDAMWLHILMVAMAIHMCIAASLMLAPTVVQDTGGGIPSDAKRWLSFSGGSAAQRGEATVATMGRTATTVDRLELRGTPAPTRARLAQGAGPSAKREPAVEAWSDVWETPGRRSIDPLGGVVWWQAQAPMAGMDVGGLSLHDPLAAQAQLGTIGIGTERSADRVQQRIRALDEAQPTPPSTSRSMVLPTVIGEEPSMGLDPLVRDHLARQMRNRHDAIRACYVAHVLSKHARDSGRLELSFRISNEGRPTAIRVHGDDILQPAFACIHERAATWYLGEGLVATDVELVFPFRMQPQAAP
jgi:hypothetical protein